MTEPIYWRRARVLAAVGGRRRMKRLEAAGVLRRVYLPPVDGKKGYALYAAAEVRNLLDRLASGSGVNKIKEGGGIL